MTEAEKPKPIVVNQSAMKTFQNCQRLYGWEYLQNLQPSSRRSALEIGIAAHAALAIYHSDGAGDMEKAIGIAKASLADRGGPSTVFEDKSVAESQAIVEEILRGYAAYWKAQDETWTPLNQEVEFLVEVGTGTGVYLRGRADNLSIYKGALYLVDYKTAGRMDPRDLLKYDLDIQLTGYVYGLSKQLTADSLKEGGEPVRVEGAVIDLLVKTKTPQYARETFTRTDEELNDFEAEFVEMGQRIRQQRDRVAAGEDWKVVFPKSTEHCFKYGTCAFRDLCLKDSPERRAAYAQREASYVDSAQATLDAEWNAERAKEKE